MSNTNANWSQLVLSFWFEELTKDDWFVASKALDEKIKDRFGTTHEQLAKMTELPLDADQHRALASVIVLDQFSRNMFRGTKDAFAFDSLALTLSKQSINRELHLTLSDDEKQFLYMPFMHSENLDDQKTSVSLFTELGRPEHAEEHLAIFKKFNRFPHRNEVLGRESTASEIEYLADARRFGQ